MSAAGRRSLELMHAQQVSAWLQTMQSPTTGDRTRFLGWLKESPRNVRDLLLMQALDRALDQVGLGHDENLASLRQSEQVVPLLPAHFRRPDPVRNRWQRPAVLVAALLIAVAAVGWLQQVRHAEEWREFTTAMGEQRAFELEDGSVVHLNTNSHLAVHFSPAARDVRLLDGEALFRVRHEAARPFRVYARDAIVQDIGTQFNVYDRDDGTVVAVVEGQVAVIARATGSRAGTLPQPESRNVGAHEEAHVSHAGVVSIRRVADVAEVVAWKERRLIFRNETLQHIVDEFNRYNGKQIVLQDKELAGWRYTGVFDADDPESLAQVLERDVRLDVTQANLQIRISRR